MNPYLKEVDKFLDDLPILERNKITSDLHQRIMNDESLLEVSPLEIANRLRVESGHDTLPPVKAKFSFGKAFLKTMLFMFICFLLFLAFLIWKFTPVLEIDNETQRITILGGLIDIDGKSGKFVIGDDVHFTASSNSNDFSGSIVSQAATSKIIINFNSGKIDFKNSETEEFSFECKLSTPPSDSSIVESAHQVILDLSQFESSSCDLMIPKDTKVIVKGDIGAIEVFNPHFDFDLELDKGNLKIEQDVDRTYYFDLSVETGAIETFNGTTAEKAEHKIVAKIKTGNIN